MKKKPKRAWRNQHTAGKSEVTIPAYPWDMGADGPANRAMLVREERGEVDPKTGKVRNPNEVYGVRRISVAAQYLLDGHITKRQFAAADQLLKAWEQKDRRPPAINEAKVDSSPKPDDHTIIILDRAWKYAHVAMCIPAKYAAFIVHVARDDRHLSSMPGYRRDGTYMRRLRDGLDMLADNLGM